MRSRPLLALVLLTSLTLGAPPASHAADKPIDVATKLLKNKDHTKRVEAIGKIQALGWTKKGEKSLVTLLRKDDDWGVQIRAARALGAIGKEPAKAALVKLAVTGEIQWVRDAAADALGVLDRPGAVKSLTNHARNKRDPDEKARAVAAAGRIVEPTDLSEIRPFLKSKEQVVATQAAHALGKLARTGKIDSQVLDALYGLLRLRAKKGHFRAYSAAVTALSSADSTAMRETALTELLSQEGEDGYIPERIGRGFASQPAEAVAETIESRLEGDLDAKSLRRIARLVARVKAKALRLQMEKLLEHDDAGVRTNAARALVVMGSPDSAPALRKLLADPEWKPRIEAVSGLAQHLPKEEFFALADTIAADKQVDVRVQFVVEFANLGDPAAIPTLGKMLQTKSWRVGSAAAATIGTLGVQEDLPLLLPLIEVKNWRIRAAGYEGMGRLRARDAIPYLVEGLGDKDPVVKGVCHTNLQILCDQKLPLDRKAWRKWTTEQGPALEFTKRSRRDADEIAAEKERGKSNEDYAFDRKERLEVLQKARILVQIDAWDKVEVVLKHLDIPHTAMRAQQLKDSGLNPNQILLVNCAGNMDKDTMDRVRWFVNVGGYVMTTDWALTKTVMPCFPGYMSQYALSSTGNDVVVVEDAMPGHPYTQGVFDNVPAMMWWLEIQAFPITVDYPERCDILVDSAEMRQRYGSSPMATVFDWGLGKVQHSLSHFYLQEEGMAKASKPRDRMVFAADNLGLSLQQIRVMQDQGAFSGRLNEAVMKQIATDYSMFRMIVNFVREKSEWVENL